MALNIETLGKMRFLLNGRDIGEQFRTDKERALLLYLANNPERAHPRDMLGEMLWPDRPPGAARTSLRQALYGVRRALEDRSADPPYILTSGDTLQVNPAAPIELDTHTFKHQLESVRRHDHPEAQSCRQCTASLEAALTLYRGEFLDGLFLDESLIFHEWLLLERERLQQDYLLVLEKLSQFAGNEHNKGRVVELARRLVAANPLDESSHRLLMNSLAETGRRSLALEHYQECRRLMLEELGVEPSQETREAYENIRDGSPKARKKTGSLRRRTNLPGQLTAFIGRERELEWFERCLQRPECRLITISGMSGIGKSRLALEVCRKQTAQFEDGVWYVQVESLQETEQLVYSIGNTLGLHFDEFSPQRTQLIHFLAQLDALVMLDGFENLVHATGLLIEILQRAPEVKIMVTTRVRLNYQSVCILELQGLEYPHNGMIKDAVDTPAVQLFLSRAQRVQPAFEMNEETLAEVVQLCQLVEGHPLALELAASGLRMRTCRQIVEDIQTNLDSLQTLQLDIPERHRSIRAALDHVWLSLALAEQQALIRLCVMRGKFGLAAAQAIADCDIQMLSGLVGKSLLLQDGLNRFWLQPLVRTYLQEILQRDPEQEMALRSRYSRYYLHFVNQRTAGLLKGERLCQLLDELEVEIDHIRQAWKQALERQAWEEVLLAVEGLKHYFDVGGNLPEGRRWMAKLVAALAVSLLCENPPDDIRMLAGLAYESLGWLNFRMGHLATAYENLLESRRLLEQVVTVDFPEIFTRSYVDVLNQLGFAAAALGDYDRAREFFQQALDFAVEKQEKRAQAFSRLYLAEFSSDMQPLQERDRIYRECLQLFSHIGDHRGAVRALINLGDSAFQQGRNEKALRFYQAAQDQVGPLDSGWASAALLLKQAGVARAQGNFEQAIENTTRSLEIYQEVGDLRRICAALNLLGGMYLSRRQFNEAVVLHEEALQLAVEVGSTPLVLACLMEVGYGYSMSGAIERAQQIYQQVLAHPAATQAERQTAVRRLSECVGDTAAAKVELTADRTYLESAILDRYVSRLLNGETLIPERILDDNLQTPI